MENITNEQKMIFAKNQENIEVLSSLLQESKTRITQLIGEDQWTTLVNAMTLEIENKLVERLIMRLAELKVGKF